MKLIKISVLFILLAVLSNCSIWRSFDKAAEEKLKAEIGIWQNFRIDGIAKIGYKRFNLVKNITISRDSLQLKATLYNSGLLAFSPQPFAKIVLEDSLYYEIPYLQELGDLPDIKEISSGLEIIKESLLIEKELMPDIVKIARTHRWENQDKLLIFNKNLQIITYLLKNSPVELRFSRNFSRYPESISIFYEKKLAATIEIDKFRIKDF
jgi:hypothetical protein